MHYYIDGYNMLFRLKHGRGDLQNKRQSIILDLNQKCSLVKWDISIVFDSIHQEGESTRTHFENLEILFTSMGETADDYILEELRHNRFPKNETVVTSDKKLAALVRHFSAHTETVETFIQKLDRSYIKKLQNLKEAPPKLKEKIPSPKQRQIESSTLILPNSAASIEECQDYYQRVFEEEWQEILKNEKEEEELEKKELALLKLKKRHPRKSKPDPFLSSQPLEPSASNEMERWLMIFEDRLLS